LTGGEGRLLRTRKRRGTDSPVRERMNEESGSYVDWGGGGSDLTVEEFVHIEEGGKKVSQGLPSRGGETSPVTGKSQRKKRSP